MPTKSPFPTFEVPKEDIWGFIFERKEKAFPDDKGIQHPFQLPLLNSTDN